MRKIREVLRLHAECGLAGRAIGRSLNIAPATVYDYLGRFRVANLTWPLPAELDDDKLDRLLFPPVTEVPGDRVVPDWAYVHQELRRPGVTLLLLWEEYKSRHGERGFQYSWFCERYREWAKVVDVVMRQDHVAGEKLFVDYSGSKLAVTDRRTGEVCPVELFVAVLGASGYTFVHASWTQSAEDWVSAHIRTFRHLGGVPAILVPDNLKAGVTRPCRYDPDLHPTYQEMARHYGTAVIPARVRKPRDKAKVEGGVLLVKRWIVAVLRERTFYTLAELNQAIWELVERLNDRPFKKLEGSRRSLFETLDRPALKPLPAKPYELAVWSKARVGIDYHVEYARHYYSVPYTLARQEVELRVTPGTVEILYKGNRVASHPRSRERRRHTTLREHMPEGHLKLLEWTPERLTAWAGRKGEHVARMAVAIMAGRDHPAQGFRACLGLLRLERIYGAGRLDAACRRALHHHSVGYTVVERILKAGHDELPLPPREPAPPPSPGHDNVRGAAYYATEVPHA